MLEIKFANHPHTRFNFYSIIGCETKAGCQNLKYNLLNQNHNDKICACGNIGNIQANIFFM